MSKCKYCRDRVPKYHEDGGGDFFYWEWENSDSLATGDLCTLEMGIDENRKIIIFGNAEELSNYYYPKFCPECGRKLKDKGGD